MMLMGEYFHLVTGSFIVACVFFGGWSLFGLESFVTNPVLGAVLKLVVLVGSFAVVLQYVRVAAARLRALRRRDWGQVKTFAAGEEL